jgi:hypothetical protein
MWLTRSNAPKKRTLTLNSTTNTVKRQLLEREYAAKQALAKSKAKTKKK